MSHFIVLLLGMVGGGICVFVALDAKRKRLDLQNGQLVAEQNKTQEMIQAINAGRHELEQQTARMKTEQKARQQEFEEQATRLKAERAEFEARIVSYRELQDENTILKRDLQNVDVNLRKLQLDRELQRETQKTLDRRSKYLGSRYLNENIKWIGSSLNPNNFANCKQRLQNVIEWCRGIGFGITAEEEATLLENLREEYKKAVRAAFEREEQARIKTQIRQEQRLQKEIERELERLERERIAIQAALDKALAEAKDQHSEEVERLKARLAEAEDRSRRAISQAQMTKAGHVYVISNIGSFGRDVFKIGMTRRLEPMERIDELSSASVPFPFDVHMMVSSNDAPTLENQLHRALRKLRINKARPRKEFFKTDIEAIRRIVEENHGEVQYVADAEAIEYNQSLDMSDEDQEFIESVYDELDEESETIADEE